LPARQEDPIRRHRRNSCQYSVICILELIITVITIIIPLLVISNSHPNPCSLADVTLIRTGDLPVLHGSEYNTSTTPQGATPTDDRNSLLLTVTCPLDLLPIPFAILPLQRQPTGRMVAMSSAMPSGNTTIPLLIDPARIHCVMERIRAGRVVAYVRSIVPSEQAIQKIGVGIGIREKTQEHCLQIATLESPLMLVTTVSTVNADV
jgi:hypothetical protein